MMMLKKNTAWSIVWFSLVLCILKIPAAYGESVSLRGERFEAGFVKNEGCISMDKLADPAQNASFISSSDSDVWRIRLKKRDWTTFEMTSRNQATEQTLRTGPAGELIATWKGVLQDKEPVLSVCVTGRMERGSRMSTWRIEVTDVNPKYAVYEVDFPSLTLGQLTPDGKDDLLVFPSYGYRLIGKPQAYSFVLPLSAEYPGGAQMQLMAFYAENKSGLYIAAHDGRSYYKGFSGSPSPDGKTLRLWVTQYPEDRTTPGKSYRMPYDAVLGSFDGTWWTASKIYREWALKQSWCAKGPLEKRKDVSTWYKDSGVWQLVWASWQDGSDPNKMIVDGSGPYGHIPLEDLVEIYKIDYDGLPVTIHLYGWMHRLQGRNADSAFGEYFPPSLGEDRLRGQIKKMHAANMRVVPYIQAWLCSREIDWFKQGGSKSAIRNEDGRMNDYGQAEVQLTWMCAYSQGWQDKIVDVCKELAGYGVDGIYLDCLSALAPQCFDKTHGHPLGGGNYYAEGTRKMMEKVRAEVHKTHPDLAFFGEWYNEVAIGVVDGGFNAIVSPFTRNPDGIPMFASVYHDYIMYYANSVHPEEPNEHMVRIIYAHSFIHGAQLGWVPSCGWENLRKAAPFAASLARIRNGPAKKFLAFGEMVKPPVILNELPSVTTPAWYSGVSKEAIKFPAVMHSAWKASDGTLGLIFINISGNPQKVRYALNLSDYGITARSIQMKKMGLKRSDPTREYSTPLIEGEESIAPSEVLVLEIAPVIKWIGKASTRDTHVCLAKEER